MAKLDAALEAKGHVGGGGAQWMTSVTYIEYA
jgi:hypothetical protein